MFAKVMYKPSIVFAGVTIFEPATAITNFVLSVFCLAFFLKLRKSNAKIWPYFFLLMSSGSFIGAFGHSLFSDNNNIIQHISRINGVIAVFVASWGSIILLQNKVAINFLKAFVIIQFSIALSKILMVNDFSIVKLNSILGLGIIVGGIHLYLAISSGCKGSIYMLTGILINAGTAILHALKISINKWFNYNDISHIVLIVGFYFMALGVSKLKKYDTITI